MSTVDTTWLPGQKWHVPAYWWRFRRYEVVTNDRLLVSKTEEEKNINQKLNHKGINSIKLTDGVTHNKGTQQVHSVTDLSIAGYNNTVSPDIDGTDSHVIVYTSIATESVDDQIHQDHIL